uniref:DSBA oxidoreductase domain containing protein n=1 Tax=Haemonchus contortus TaxID=6289 RepID=W6NHB9_HAECO
MTSKTAVKLYYDVISPYSWVAFESLLRYQFVWPIEVFLKPFSLQGIRMLSGNKPPGTVKNKLIYMLNDLQRSNEFWNMNISAPKDFMEMIEHENSDNAMKLLLIIQKERPGKFYTEFFFQYFISLRYIFISRTDVIAEENASLTRRRVMDGGGEVASGALSHQSDPLMDIRQAKEAFHPPGVG